MMVTTTPRPIRALKQLIGAPDTVVTNAKTWENVGNVAADFLAALRARWTGDARHRQEILGELIEDVDGALWRRADIEAARGSADGGFARVVVAVDPPATSGANADACGIIAAAARGEGVAREAFVLADASVRGARPNEWAGRVAALVKRVGADYVVAESNNGGEMVRAVLAAAGIKVGVQLVHASIGKRARAEPIAALYAQRRVKHVAAFAELEDEMCAFGVESGGKSPDRVDALVWALTDLMLHARGGPRARML
jgi:phage terminase large subunit-like protein